MSPENLRLRFFAASHRSAESAADRMTAKDRPGYRALAAESAGRIASVSRPAGRQRGEA
jgi:hypothetical protein